MSSEPPDVAVKSLIYEIEDRPFDNTNGDSGYSESP